MTKNQFALFLLMALVAFRATPGDLRAESRKDLFPIDQNGKWGFINATGQIVIQPTFESVSYFSEDVAAVQLDGKFGYIDKGGDMVIEPQFDYAFPFSEGLAWVRARATRAFIDKTGKFVVFVPNDRYSRWYRDGLAKSMPIPPRPRPQLIRAAPQRAASLPLPGGIAPQPTRRIGFIDETGDYAFEARFASAWDFREGLAAVLIDKKWGFIDRTGDFVIRPRYENAANFSEGVAAVKFGGKTIFVNKDGKHVVGEYQDAHGFSEGLAAVMIDGKWGFVDKSGAVVIEPTFDSVSPFSHGRASIVMNKKYGYIDRKGKVVVQPTYAYGHAYLGELAGVTFHPAQGDGAGTGYVNQKGHVVWEPRPIQPAGREPASAKKDE